MGTVVRYELPDHSVVWLNSGSKLRYPTVFKKDNRNQRISQRPIENSQLWQHKAKIRKGTHQTEKQITDPELFSQIFFIQKNIKKALYDRQSTAFQQKINQQFTHKKAPFAKARHISVLPSFVGLH